MVKAALRSVHGEEKIANEVSGYYLAGHLERTYAGMMIAIPEDEWRLYSGDEHQPIHPDTATVGCQSRPRKVSKTQERA